MKLKNARLCMDCNEVFEDRPGSGIPDCPVCGYPVTVLLKPWLDAPPEDLGRLNREEKSFIANMVAYFIGGDKAHG